MSLSKFSNAQTCVVIRVHASYCRCITHRSDGATKRLCHSATVAVSYLSTKLVLVEHSADLRQSLQYTGVGGREVRIGLTAVSTNIIPTTCLVVLLNKRSMVVTEQRICLCALNPTSHVWRPPWSIVRLSYREAITETCVACVV